MLHRAKFECHSFKDTSILRETLMSGFLWTTLVEQVILNTQLAVNDGCCTSGTIANSRGRNNKQYNYLNETGAEARQLLSKQPKNLHTNLPKVTRNNVTYEKKKTLFECYSVPKYS